MGSSRWVQPETGSVYEIPDEDAPPLCMTRHAYLFALEDHSEYLNRYWSWVALGRRGPQPQPQPRITGHEMEPYRVERAS